jgi:small GTP-binding protein
MTETISYSKKVLLLGDPSVGKTSLIKKFVYDKFDDAYISTLGTKVTHKQVFIDDPEKNVKVQLNFLIWDMMGQKEYKLLHSVAYQGAMGAIIVCDITRHETLDNIPDWISDLFKVTGDIPLVFIGNKNDLLSQKQFEFIDLKVSGDLFKAPVFFTSAKTGLNVEKAFLSLGEGIIGHNKK